MLRLALRFAVASMTASVIWSGLTASAVAELRVEGPILGVPVLGTTADADWLAERGFVQQEFFLSGTATSYIMDGTFPEDGRATVEPGDKAPFVTRILLRRPASLADFNGTVVVEWMNVTGGTDAAPDFSFMHRHLARAGYAWVGVSAQQVGIGGGPASPAALGTPMRGGVNRTFARLGHTGGGYY
jgi:hypothetical protein